MPQKGRRSQRPTLTYSQQYGRGGNLAGARTSHAGMMEGKGIFSAIGKWLKKTKVLSKIARIAGPVIGLLPFPGAAIAGTAVGVAGKVAEMKGFGLPQKIKSITRNQVEAIKRGLGKLLDDGSISLTGAKGIFPKIRNVTKTQLKALGAFRGRHMKGGGISLAGGRATGMSGMGFSGSGVKLAGSGVKLAGTGGTLAGGRMGRRVQNATRSRQPKMAGRGQPLIGGQKKVGASRVLVLPRF